MNWSQVIFQLGISSLIVYVCYQIAMVWIARFFAADEKRTDAMTVGFNSLSTKMDNHSEVQGEIRDQVSRFGGQLDAVVKAKRRSNRA